MKKILITGASGLLGQKLVKTFSEKAAILPTGHKPDFPFILNYSFLDITNFSQVKEVVQSFSPEIIINAAAYTDVDGCEIERDLCWQTNFEAVKNLSEICKIKNIYLVQISTDYVFDGKNGPYSEEDQTNPASFYGKTKLEAEKVIQQNLTNYAIIRSNVLYGNGFEVKKNFVLWVLENLRAKNKIKVVTDQFNNPTLADNLAEAILELVEKNFYGIIHIAGREYLSRFEMAQKIATVFNLDKNLIEPAITAELSQKAVRPKKGGLKIEKAQKVLSTPLLGFEEGLVYLKKHFPDI